MNDFTALTARLDSIDHSLANINQRVSASGQKAAADPTTPSIDDSIEDVQIFYRAPENLDREHQDADSVSAEAFHHVHRKFDDSGGERYYGSNSVLSQFDSCRKLLGDALSPEGVKRDYKLSRMLLNNPSLKAQLYGFLEQFPFIWPRLEPDTASDGRQVAEPPRSFLNSIIDVFVNEFNSIRPVFDERKLLRNVKEPSNSALNDAEILCYNNIVLLALSLVSQSARRNSSEANAMNDDLVGYFVNNSRRALDHLDLYVEPRLINIQALTSLVSYQIL